jgi:hypothetical protein
MKKDEEKLQQTRPRSLASKRHRFDFIDGYQKSVVPIFKFSKSGTIELIGTGFFVAVNGIMATAKHVFEGNDIQQSDKFEILQECGNEIYKRPIKNIIGHPSKDLAITQLDNPHDSCSDCSNHPIVSIMELPPEKNEVVASFSFSHTVVHEPEPYKFSDGKALAQLVRYRSHWEIGLAEDFYPDGLMFVEGPCFTTSIFVEGRGSGGPVFNSNGFVIGLNSTGFAQDEGLPHSTASCICSILDLKIGNQTIRENRKETSKLWPNKPIALRQSLFK